MAEHNDQGKFGEEQALGFLKKLGYTIIECNWQFKKFEIDILAFDGEMLVVIEVKTRKNADFGSPESFVSRQKQAQLIKAVNHYVDKKELLNEIRFDVISVLYDGKNVVVEHIPEAFYPIAK